MAIQTVFQRYEIKYIISREQKKYIIKEIQPYMELDQYGHSTIRNLYYDTDSFRLVRRSNEKPVYKEKLRVRSYRQIDGEEPVYVELKKKFDSVVYKRRIALAESDAVSWLSCGVKPTVQNQIVNEIEYFRQYYETLQPRVFLSYEREAFRMLDGTDFRLTFDENVLARTERLSLRESVGGAPLLSGGRVLMELKTSAGFPLWMTKLLTEHRLYKASFSKYGTAYTEFICRGEGELQYVG